MNTQNYTVSFTVDQSPQSVFDAINNVRGWWAEDEEGDTDRPGAVFYHHYKDVHRCTLKITEFVPGQRVKWHVLHNDFNFVKGQDPSGMAATSSSISRQKGGTDRAAVHAHRAASNARTLDDVCSNAWGQYINVSLRKLITTGEGEPNPVDEHAVHQDEVVAKVREMNRKLESERGLDG